MFRWFRVIVDPYGHRPFFEQGSGADRTRDLDQKNPSLKARNLNLRTRIKMFSSSQVGRAGPSIYLSIEKSQLKTATRVHIVYKF